MKNFIIYALVFISIVENAAFAKSSFEGVDLMEQATEAGDLVLSREQFEELKDGMKILELTKAENEILGGKIVNAENGSEIFIECVEKNQTNDCMKVQYIYKQGVASHPITPVIEMSELLKKFNAFKDTFKEYLVNIEKAQKEKFQSEKYDYVYLTRKLYPNFNYETGAFVVGLVGAVTTLVGLMSIAPILFFVITLSVTGSLYMMPAITDVIMMPYKLTRNGVKKLIMKRKIRKAHKQMQRLVLAVDATLAEGNKQVTLDDKDFQLLLNFFKQGMSTPAAETSGEIK